MHVFDKLRLRIGARIGGKQPLLIGQQQQLIGSGKDRRQRRKIVVVTDFNFSGRHRIVLIDDRNNVVIQQRAQRIAGVEEALSVFHIRTR